MQTKSIYINLPIKDTTQTRIFWTALGFSFIEQFSNEQALCLLLKENSTYAMLITKEFYATFTNRPISDHTTTQSIVAIEVESKAEVDIIIEKAIANGATRYKEPVSYDWMYYDSFTDIDGNQWEIMHTDYSKWTPEN
ncbi:MAG: glyoxalase/bleomycin resistance/extradiol dioxygenase family protein [Cytophagales bacterium]|nr:MAG: glyoxalase/bleomycin resistance/extradiol dioxygenase family protein [Cytophagales bacterium]